MYWTAQLEGLGGDGSRCAAMRVHGGAGTSLHQAPWLASVRKGAGVRIFKQPQNTRLASLFLMHPRPLFFQSPRCILIPPLPDGLR